MLLSANYRSKVLYPQQPLPHQESQSSSQPRIFDLPSSHFASGFPLVLDSDLDSALYGTSLGGDEESVLFAGVNTMNADTWHATALPVSRTATSRMSHHRDSSLSSIGSTGPASPYSHNTANPQIAITDSTGDSFHGLPQTEDFRYQIAKSFQAPPDTFYANYPNYASADAVANAAYANMAAAHRQKSDRSLLPPPDFSPMQSRSRPVSVASSVTSDSPATPLLEPEDDRRRKTAFPSIPKLDRTMTDIYSDELYSPSFTITSAPPIQASPSPCNELFAQRLQAANSQHLSTPQSPVPIASRGRSPFRQGSPLAPAPSHEFPTVSQHMGFQHIRDQQLHTAQIQQQLALDSNRTGTPQTISPKDAMLDFNSPEGEANFPLFPQHDSSIFDTATNKNETQSPAFDGLQLDDTPFNFSQLSVNIQLPQQYPFIAQPQPHSHSSPMNHDSARTSRLGSIESRQSDHTHEESPRRPAGTGAEGGTYTCTYHGCTLRFETPALLQKHKREGHRQTHGLTGPRRPEPAPTIGMTSALLNTQAGPHKCERTNPSTGKPCNTVFSRPYDLTRHEDTIHNARKQKVRCNMCTDEKTFSRADALTRHFRVCHPEVEFSGKHRKRGGPGA